MNLNEMPKLKAYSKDTKRRGKGVGSGNGKTSGRGHKGGKARSGYSPSPCCCGIPFYRHMPIRGFSNYNFRMEYEIVQLSSIVALGLPVVDKQIMSDNFLIKSNESLVKVLNDCEFGASITVVSDKFSASAKASINKAGGKFVELIEKNKQ